MPKRYLDLERKWRIKYVEYKKSGQSVKGWCKEKGIVPTTFRYWIKRFENLEEFPPSKAEFAKITLESNSTNNDTSTPCEAFSEADTIKDMQIQYSEFQVFFNNIRLTVPGNFSPASLLELMKVLKTL